MHSVNIIQLTLRSPGKQTKTEIIDKKHLCTGIRETELLLILWISQLLLLLAKFSVWIPYSLTHACGVWISVTFLTCQTEHFLKIFLIIAPFIYVCLGGVCK